MSDSAGAPKLFISYRRDETPVSAAWLYAVLVERFGEQNVFMDLKLKAGENFVKRISEVVGSCHILLLVMGPRWADPEDGEGAASIRDPDDFVRLEAEIAMARDDVQVLPVLVGGAKMPHPDELPEQLRELTQIHAKQLTNERRAEDMEELVGRVDELLPPETFVHVPDPPPPPPEKPSETKRRRQPRRWIAAAAVAALGVIAAIVVATGGNEEPKEPDGTSRVLGSDGDRAEVWYQADEAVGDLDGRGDMVILAKGSDKEFRLLGEVDATDHEFEALDTNRSHYNGIDVGTDAGERPVVVASRCGTNDDKASCKVYRWQPGASGKPVPGLSTPPCGAIRPSMDAGRILFSRDGDSCEDRGLYIADSGEGRQLAPRPAQAADIEGDTAAALSGPRTLDRYELGDVGSPTETIQLPAGHKAEGPMVVHDRFVYFVDQDESGYFIARIKRHGEPELEHYVPADAAGPSGDKPYFGVTTGGFYFSGLPRTDDKDPHRLIVRDSDPVFKDVDGAQLL